jgi:serine/threonine protein kinase
VFERGTIIRGKYRVERVIGEGGMGVVLAARHLGLDEMVAVKLIRGERATQADALTRFQREARAAARLKSEHVARVLDVDRLDDGAPYIVLEYIDGTDLDAHVRKRGRLPLEEAVKYLAQACEGLAEAHAHGMVHRDLKLKNLFLTRRPDGRELIKVIDFGVVKFREEGALSAPVSGDDPTAHAVPTTLATLTGASAIVGSVHYMSPEQIRASNDVDARADVWSLGICLFAMLTGELPFEGNDVATVCAAIQGRPAPNILERAPHLPPEVGALIERALEKSVRRRFANVAELASALTPLGADPEITSRIAHVLSKGPRAVQPVGSSSSSLEDATTTMTSSPPAALAKGRVDSTIDAAAAGGSIAETKLAPSPPKRRASWITGAIVLVSAAALVVGVNWALHRPSPETHIQPASEPTPTPTTTSSGAPLAASAPPVVSAEPSAVPAPIDSAAMKKRPPAPIATPPTPPTKKTVARPPAKPPTTPTATATATGDYDKF